MSDDDSGYLGCLLFIALCVGGLVLAGLAVVAIVKVVFFM